MRFMSRFLPPLAFALLVTRLAAKEPSGSRETSPRSDAARVLVLRIGDEVRIAGDEKLYVVVRRPDGTLRLETREESAVMGPPASVGESLYCDRSDEPGPDAVRTTPARFHIQDPVCRPRR